jgi:sugar phosphate isomerase/epimerase
VLARCCPAGATCKSTFIDIKAYQGHRHLSIWNRSPRGALVGRCLPGHGYADRDRLRRAADAAGYDGPIEVEVLNEDVWATPGDDVLLRLVADVGP